MKIRQYVSSVKLDLTELIGKFRISLAELKGSKRKIDLRAADG